MSGQQDGFGQGAPADPALMARLAALERENAALRAENAALRADAGQGAPTTADAAYALLMQGSLDALPHAVSMVDASMRFSAWNRAFADLVGLEAPIAIVPDILATPARLADRPAVAVKLGHPLIAGQFHTVAGIGVVAREPGALLVSDVRLGDGRIFQLHRTIMPSGGFVTTYRDVTEARAVADSLRRSEELVRRITDSLPALLVYVDADQRYQFVNRQFERWFDRPREAVLGLRIQEILPSEVVEALRTYGETAMRGIECTFEHTRLFPDGRLRTTQVTYIPHFGDDGQVLGYFGMLVDMTERKRFEEDIAASEAKLRLLTDSVPAMIAVAGLDRRYQFVNKGLEDLYGLPRHEILGHVVEDFVTGESLPLILECIDQVLSGAVESAAIITAWKSRTFDARYMAYRDANGDLAGYIVLLIDRSERRRLERAVDEGARRLRSIIDSLPAGLCYFDRDLRFGLVNRCFEEWHGIDRANVEGQLASERIPPEEWGPAEQFLRAALAGQPTTLERTFDLPWQAGRRLIVNHVPDYAEDGSVVGVLVLFVDATDRYENEVRLRRSEEMLRLVTDGIQASVSYADADMILRFANKGFADRVGRPIEAVLGHYIDEFFSPEMNGKMQPYENLARQGCSSTVAYQEISRTTGELRHRTVSLNPQMSVDGQFMGLYMLSVDVTDQKQQEEALRESERTLRLVTEGLPALIVYVDTGLVIRFVNSNFRAVYHMTDESVIGHPLSDVLPPETLRQLQPSIDRALGGEVTQVDDYVVIENGNTFYRQATYVPHFDAEGRVIGLYGMGIDVTERKKAELALRKSEEALRESEARLRLITDTMPALIGYVDSDLRIQFANRQHLIWGGFDPADMIGRHLKDSFDPEVWPHLKEIAAKALSGSTAIATLRRTMPDGSFRFRQNTSIPRLDADGKVLGFYYLVLDLTDRVMIEDALRESETRLQRAAAALQDANETLERRVEERTAALQDANIALADAKMEAERANLSKTRFLASASHDLLQPLAAARVYISALAERQLTPRNRALVESTVAAMDAVDELLTALLDISRLDAGVLPVERRTFLVGDLINTIGEEHRLMATEKGLAIHIATCTAAVNTDPRLLARVVRNFVSNAIRYTDHGKILLGCRRRGENLLVGVWDTGSGIDPDRIDEVFEEFRRLPDAEGRNAHGIGLGLAIVKRIASTLESPLVVQSEPGRGSLFGILVPLSNERPQPRLGDDSGEGPRASAQAMIGATVLLIDNEPDLLKGLATLLQGWGCRTVLARSEEAAVKLMVERKRYWPDLIIADYHLDDGKTGVDAIAAVQQVVGVAMPAFVLTADHTPPVAQAVRAAGYHILNKPVRPGRLRSLMAHLLSQRDVPQT